MGIGMGQNLGHIPAAFVLVAGLFVLAPQLLGVVRQRWRECVATAAVLAAAFCSEQVITRTHAAQPVLTPAGRGRQVYISEGCINCHSQYVRPNTPDMLMWGPVQTVEELHQERPPLIGNRRQGPDLAEVGARRSPLWLKAHLFKPREVSHASFMPSYAHLFREHGEDGDSRGDDLVAYLRSLQHKGTSDQFVLEQSWRASSTAIEYSNASDGASLFNAYCSTCHAANGLTRQRWKSSFQRLPPDLAVGPFLYLPDSDSPTERTLRLARMIKFGVPGSDMPGHEYLPDREIVSISIWLNQSMPKPNGNGQTTAITGEKQ
jgi:cytochrome c oxidase cbb3-type subunit 2